MARSGDKKTENTQDRKQLRYNMDRKQIKIFSTNINGLNSPQKRKRTFVQMKKLQAEILCLQETHIKEYHRNFLTCKQLGQAFIACDKD